MGSRASRGPSPSAFATCASTAGIMKPVQDTLTTMSISPGPREDASRARRATSAPARQATSRYFRFWVSKSAGWKTSSIGTTLARDFTPADA